VSETSSAPTGTNGTLTADQIDFPESLSDAAVAATTAS
jgi:hypothetical protein